jgi:16S rRNA (guanine966-N2)-methyltransferase
LRAVRVVAGTARGRRLVAPPGASTRPTADRVREAVFNSLGSLGAVDDARVLDLFAGSGALGIEALSRGARHATFVDDDTAALRAIRENLDTTGLGDRATVVQRRVEDYLVELATASEAVDVAVIDPPYAFDSWPELLARLPAALVVAESDRAVTVPADWRVLREKRYGTTVVTIARRDIQPDDEERA